MEYKVGVISGDGIGPEIVTEAKKVLDPAAWLGAGLSAGANPPAFPDAADLDSANSAFSTTTSVEGKLL